MSIPIDNHISEQLGQDGNPEFIQDLSQWTYVDLHALNNNNNYPWYIINHRMNIYLEWLTTKLGHRGINWEFRIGDLYARGIYFKDPGDALMFKLAFSV